MRKNTFNGIDRKESSNGRLNTLQIVWLAYSLAYIIIAGRRNTGTFFEHIYISDEVMIIMTVVAFIFCIGVLIYNHKYESFRSVKRFGYFLTVCNALGLEFFLESLYF